jgi:hypothetical protein
MYRSFDAPPFHRFGTAHQSQLQSLNSPRTDVQNLHKPKSYRLHSFPSLDPFGSCIYLLSVSHPYNHPVRNINSHQMRKRVRVPIENNRRRRTPKRACGARILSCSQAVDCVAAIVVDGPATDAVTKGLLVANAVIEAWADGCCERGEEEGSKGREVHFGLCRWRRWE